MALVASGCSSTETASPSSSASASAQPSGAPAGGGPGGQTFTAVNLNTDGESPGGANTAEVVKAVNDFLATLDAAKRDTATYAFTDNQQRQTWSNYPVSAVPREGIALADLDENQRKAAMAVVEAALGDAGYQRVLDIQKSDDYLAGLEAGGATMGATTYQIAIYGEPSETQPFMVQFGGHHLARNLTYNGDKVSQTPSFTGAEPPSFQTDGATVEPMKTMSSAIFGMVEALTEQQRSAAELSGTFDDLIMGPGKDDGSFPASEGVLVSELNDDQRKLVTAAIQAYVGDLDDAAAAKLLAKYESEYGQTRVGWANNSGATESNTYIRIDGPSVWLEFINTTSRSTDGIHYHSVYRDKTNDYGSTKPS